MENALSEYVEHRLAEIEQLIDEFTKIQKDLLAQEIADFAQFGVVAGVKRFAGLSENATVDTRHILPGIHSRSPTTDAC